jgi:hypothetical protein
MIYKPFDVAVIKGHIYNPMEWIIYQRTSTIWGHTAFIKNESGAIFDPRMKGIENNHISKYAHRKMVIRRYKYPFDENKMMAWCLDKQKKAKHYDFLSLIGYLTGIKALNDPNNWSCSEFPYWAFMNNDCRLTDEELTFIYPNFFLVSNDFTTIN